jgi:VanZ family protein
MPMTDRWLEKSVYLLSRRRWLASAVWAVVILTVSSLPDPAPRLPLFPGCDKILHFIEYSILGAGLRYWSGGVRPLFLIGGAGFAALDEFHQRYVPGREASPWDWVADLAGLAIGFIFFRRAMGKRLDG